MFDFADTLRNLKSVANAPEKDAKKDTEILHI